MNVLDLAGIGHSYFGRKVLDQIDLAVRQAEVVALVGPSGCGKSTLVHIAAELIEPTQGTVRSNYLRHAMVFQEPRLLPWATAQDNIAYPLRFGAATHRERHDRALAAARQVSFDEADLGKYPVELSGGMRQRVAIARALCVEPDFLFFDEPFTALDVALKRHMQDMVIEATGASRCAALFVTHDLSEAVRIAHRIVVLSIDGSGIAGERALPGTPGARDERMVFDLVQEFLNSDSAFHHIHDIDERRLA